jgi:hypothetical protein
VVALDARTGARRWEAQVAIDCGYGRTGLAVTDGSVVVGSGQALLILDRASGALRHTLALGGDVEDLVASPLAVVVRTGPDSEDLLAIDDQSGLVTATTPFHELVHHIIGAGSHVVLSTSGHRVIGLRAGDLAEAWRREGFKGVERIDGVIHLLGPDYEVLPLADPSTGTVGPLHRGRSTQECVSPDTFPSGLRTAARGQGLPCLALQRYDPLTATVLWETQMPQVPERSTRVGEVLLVHVGARRRLTSPFWGGAPRWRYSLKAARGRGYLVVLDWNTGRLRRAAYGLRPVRFAHVSGDRLVLSGEDGIVAISTRDFGPAASRYRVRDEVQRTLSRPAPRDQNGAPNPDVVGELLALGPEAAPALAAAVPGLDDDHLGAAAVVLQEARHRPAAPALAARLRETLGRTDDKAGFLQAELLGALNYAGGEAEVDLVAGMLTDEDRPRHVRRLALHALAGIGGPRAADALDRVLARPARSTSWWHPPSPAALLADIGRPIDNKAIDRLPFDEGTRLRWAASAARAPLPDGRSLVVFEDDWLGYGQLWAAEIGGERRLLPALFLGARPGSSSTFPYRITARVSGTLLEVDRTDGPGQATFDLAEAARDADADGLTDVVERYLGTDPVRRDSDGDGLEDAEDSDPTTARQPPQAEEQQVIESLFPQLFMFELPHEEWPLLAILSEFALDWYGYPAPTLTRSPSAPRAGLSQAAAQARELRMAAVTGDMTQNFPLPPRRVLGADEREYAYGFGGLDDWIIVRKVGRHWVVRDVCGSIDR